MIYDFIVCLTTVLQLTLDDVVLHWPRLFDTSGEIKSSVLSTRLSYISTELHEFLWLLVISNSLLRVFDYSKYPDSIKTFNPRQQESQTEMDGYVRT